MTNNEANEKYLEYLEGHIGNVKEAFELLCALDIPFIQENKSALSHIIEAHDESKYDDFEWIGYLHHFYPTCDEDSLKTEEFEEACRHHIQNNPHHWDYWVEDGKLIDDIDEHQYKLYTVERICDHMAMSIQNNNKPADWYFANKEHIIMPDYGYEFYEDILAKIPEDYDLSYHGTRNDGKPERDMVNEEYNVPEETKLKYMNDLEDAYDLYRVIYVDEKYINNLEINGIYDNLGKIESWSKNDNFNPTERLGNIKITLFIDGKVKAKRLPYDNLRAYAELDMLDGEEEHYLPSDTVLIIKNIDKISEDEYFVTLQCFVSESVSNNKEAIADEYIGGDGYYVIELADGWVTPTGDSYIWAKNKREAYQILKNCYKEKDNLNEAKASQLRNKTKSEDPARVKKSKNVKTTYIGMSKFGILNFKTTSESRSGYHYQTVEFQSLKPFEELIKKNGKIMPMDVKQSFNDQDINVYCSDESFTYWAWYHQAYQNDYAYIDDAIPDLNKRLQAPKVNNVRLAGALCKHLYSVLEYITRPFVLLAISDDMNNFLNQKSHKYAKQTVATQNWYDAVKQWTSEDALEYLGLTREQIIMDLSKTLRVNPTTNLDDFVDELVKDAILKRKDDIDPKLEKDIADKVIDELDLETEYENLKVEEVEPNEENVE